MFKNFWKVKFLCVSLYRIVVKQKSFLRRYGFLVGVALSVFLYGRLLLLNNEALFWDVAVLYTCSAALILWYFRKR